MKAKQLTPNFEVSHLRQTVEFYSKYLGFSLVMAVPETQDGVETVMSPDKEYVYAMIQKDSVSLSFQRSDSIREDVPFLQEVSRSASVTFYMDIEGIDEFHQFIKQQQLQVSDLKITWYGMKEFYLKDINGYILGFGQSIERHES